MLPYRKNGKKWFPHRISDVMIILGLSEYIAERLSRISDATW